MESCIFCRVAAGEAPAEVVLADDEAIAFRDLMPKAPTHLLVIPRRHIASLAHAVPEDQALLGRLDVVTGQQVHHLLLAKRLSVHSFLHGSSIRWVFRRSLYKPVRPG